MCHGNGLSVQGGADHGLYGLERRRHARCRPGATGLRRRAARVRSRYADRRARPARFSRTPPTARRLRRPRGARRVPRSGRPSSQARIRARSRFWAARTRPAARVPARQRRRGRLRRRAPRSARPRPPVVRTHQPRTPGRSLATTGVPLSIASTWTSPNDSVELTLGRTRQSSAPRNAGISASGSRGPEEPPPVTEAGDRARQPSAVVGLPDDVLMGARERHDQVGKARDQPRQRTDEYVDALLRGEATRHSDRRQRRSVLAHQPIAVAERSYRLAGGSRHHDWGRNHFELLARASQSGTLSA